MEKKTVKLPMPIDPLGLFSDFIGGNLKIDLRVPDYLVPLFKFQGEEKIEVADGWGEKGEEDKVLDLLEAADKELRKGNIEGAHTHLDNALKLSRCSRCVRTMKSIGLKIREGDLSEARRRLKTLIELIPAYYEVIEKEGSLGSELNTTGEIERKCNSCDASKIIELCQWDTKCLDYVIQFIDEKKKQGEKVLSSELFETAKKYMERE